MTTVSTVTGTGGIQNQGTMIFQGGNIDLNVNVAPESSNCLFDLTGTSKVTFAKILYLNQGCGQLSRNLGKSTEN